MADPTRRTILSGLVAGVTSIAGCSKLNLFSQPSQQWKTGLPTGHTKIESPLCVTDKAIIFATHSGTLFNVSRETGDIKWDKRVSSTSSNGPAITQRAIYYAEYGVSALSHDGDTLWEKQRDENPGMRVTPLALNDIVVSGEYDGMVVARDVTTGREVWETSLEGPSPITSLIVAGTSIFASNQEGMLASVEPETGTMRWSYSGSYGQTVVGDENHIVLVGKEVTALSADTGEVEWTNTVTEPFGQPTIAEESVFVASRSTRTPDNPHDNEGRLWAFDLETGKRRWERETTPSPTTRPTVVDTQILAGMTDGTVQSFSTDGTHNWTHETKGDAVTALTVQEGAAYVGTDEVAILAFELP
ncbi:PQQ-like beta-propeller repeat protein [Haladaptatus sp. CMSO5]|uniref:PQQ-like beta-propeller repeat protein n=1 Tax=Haladaptatus sp. CMSO5 TaxID=3120514 RepID=UPI002FCE5C38